MDEKIEKLLIERAQKGDTAAFEKLIVQYEKKIYNICFRMVRNEQQAYDLAQEVCVKVWRQLHTFELAAKLSTWIFRIATNHCLDYLRKQKNKNEVSLYAQNSDTDEEWMLDIPSGEKSTERQIEDMELQDIVKQGLYELKEEYRIILVLRDIEAYSYEEIASTLELSLGTVKSRLSRARLALKKILMQNKEPYKSFFRQKNEKEGIS
ncbi:MAG: RNA polymerase sigma factor [Cellulosilyticaceae bacterium]